MPFLLSTLQVARLGRNPGAVALSCQMCSMGILRLTELPDAQFAKNPERPWTQDL